MSQERSGEYYYSITLSLEYCPKIRPKNKIIIERKETNLLFVDDLVYLEKTKESTYTLL